MMSTSMLTPTVFPTPAMMEGITNFSTRVSHYGGHRLAVKSYSLHHSMSMEDIHMNILHSIRQVVII
mgnify:CR=1 FL=1